jgi:hypothetical protein
MIGSQKQYRGVGFGGHEARPQHWACCGARHNARLALGCEYQRLVGG